MAFVCLIVRVFSSFFFTFLNYYVCINFADPFSVWNSNVSFRLNNVAKRRIRLDDGDKSKTIV